MTSLSSASPSPCGSSASSVCDSPPPAASPNVAATRNETDAVKDVVNDVKNVDKIDAKSEKPESRSQIAEKKDDLDVLPDSGPVKNSCTDAGIQNQVSAL